MTVGIFAVVMEILIGTFLGAIAGYYGGWVDWTIMRITDVFLSIPLLPLLLVSRPRSMRTDSTFTGFSSSSAWLELTPCFESSCCWTM